MKTRNSLIALGVCLFAAPGLAALADHYGASRFASLSVTCPNDLTQPCVVEVTRVRSLLPTFEAEAVALGLNQDPVVERVRKFTTTRGQIMAWLQAATPVP